MTTKTIDFNQPDAAATVGVELADSSMALAQRLRAGDVTDQASWQQAVLDRQTIGEMIDRVEAFFDPVVKMAYDLHKALCSRRNEILEPLRRVDNHKRAAISAYKEAEDRRREQREQEAADQQRQDDLARAEREAAQLETSGEVAMAVAVREEAKSAPLPVVVLPDAAKAIDGLSFRRRYLWRYAGGPKEIKETTPATIARAHRVIPREFMRLDEIKMNSYARTMKGSAVVPGIDFYHVDDPVR